MVTMVVLLACLASALYMTGVIAVIQWVHYPLFEKIDRTSFGPYHSEHMRLMTLVVLGPMLVELSASIWLVVDPPPGTSGWLTWSGLTAAVAAWTVTVVYSVPLHQRLSRGFDVEAHRALMRTNGLRVAAWLVHSGTLIVLTARAICTS